MRHPFEFCATRYCCCFDLDSDLTCYIISIICIVVNGFSGLTNIGVHFWYINLFPIFNIILFIVAGTALFLGAYWNRDALKLLYCWLLFIAIFTLIAGTIMYFLYRDDIYIIWQNQCHDFNSTLGTTILLCNFGWLLFWCVYTPMVILGNLNCVEECCVETTVEH